MTRTLGALVALLLMVGLAVADPAVSDSFKLARTELPYVYAPVAVKFDAGGAEPAPAAGAAGAKWRAYCQQRFGSTLVARAQMAQWAASMSLGELATALGCDTLTAWRELGAALDAVTPFLHARAPVDAGETPQGAIQVIIAPALAAALDADG